MHFLCPCFVAMAVVKMKKETLFMLIQHCDIKTHLYYSTTTERFRGYNHSSPDAHFVPKLLDIGASFLSGLAIYDETEESIYQYYDDTADDKQLGVSECCRLEKLKANIRL